MAKYKTITLIIIMQVKLRFCHTVQLISNLMSLLDFRLISNLSGVKVVPFVVVLLTMAAAELEDLSAKLCSKSCSSYYMLLPLL